MFVLVGKDFYCAWQKIVQLGKLETFCENATHAGADIIPDVCDIRFLLMVKNKLEGIVSNPYGAKTQRDI